MPLRRSELFAAAYFVYATGVALARPVAPDMKLALAGLNAAVILWLWILGWTDARLGHGALSRVRDWLPIPLILIAYKEMGWMGLPPTSTVLEDAWVVWDRRLLDAWGGKRAIELLGPAIPAVLELAYVLVYAVPAAAVACFYAYDQRRRLDDFYGVLLFATLTTYALYPYFPSEPPRSVFPGDLLPLDNILRRFNLSIVGGYGIHASVFPSGHVAAAFGASFGLRMYLPEARRAVNAFCILSVLIAVATVYGRYHYAVDALAGLGVAALAAALSSWRVRRRASTQT
jgi:membrane-associated phospholipid phosphatase